MKLKALLLSLLLSFSLNNISHASFEDGLDALMGKDYSSAFEIFKPLAELGDARSQAGLGSVYDLGKQDYRQAAYWYTKSAEQGLSIAQYYLGLMYRKGDGVQQSDMKAVYWYTKAANQGDAAAQNNLGFMYSQGLGLIQDYEKSFLWYTKSAEQGNVNAQYGLGTLYHQGKGVAQDDEQAFYWYTKAAEQGDAEAQYNLGIRNAKGDGIQINNKQAFYWITKAAHQGHSDARSMLTIMYKTGVISKIAEQGDADAQHYLALNFMVEQDNQQAFYWQKKAAEQGLMTAQYLLGLMYFEGSGVLQDDKKAIKWLTKSAGQGDKRAQHYLRIALELQKRKSAQDKQTNQTEIAFIDKDSGFHFPNKIAGFSYSYKHEYDNKELGYSLLYRGEQQERIDVYVYTLGAKGIQNGTDGPLVLKSHMQAYGEVQHQVQNGIYTSFLDIKDIKFPPDFINNNFSYIDTRNDHGGRQRSYLLSRGQDGYFVKVRASTLESNKNSKMFEDKLNKFLKQLLLVLNKEYEG